uniref:Uncharacterized protein n=1 Tax=Plectus sambesii TaxID=2011161 RepID=A0A914ULW4_9BILA
MPLDSYGKKSSSASSSLSYQRQQLQNGSKTGGFDFSSLMQQASSNSVDASQKITKIDKSVSAEARARASKNAIDISAAKLRKAVLERSSHKSSAVSHSADLKHHKHHKEHSKDHPAKDSAKRENSTSGLSDKDRRDKHGDKQLNGTKSLSKDKERGGKPSGQSVGASSSSKQPSKSGLGLSVGQEQKRHLAGDLRYKGETAPTSSRDGADRKTSSKPTSSSVKRPHQQMKRPAPSGMDFSKLMQQASSNLSGKPLKLTGADSGELPSNRKSMGVPAGEPRRSS